MSEDIESVGCEYQLAASTDIIQEVKDSIEKHEETVVKQEEAVKKIEESSDTKKSE